VENGKISRKPLRDAYQAYASAVIHLFCTDFQKSKTIIVGIDEKKRDSDYYRFYVNKSSSVACLLTSTSWGFLKAGSKNHCGGEKQLIKSK
jgi:hypothetical protein